VSSEPPTNRTPDLLEQLDREVEQQLTHLRTIDSPIIDAFALRAPRHASRGRRFTILLWAMGYGGTGWNFVLVAVHRHSISAGVCSVILIAVGVRIGLNVFPRRGGN